MKTSKDLYQAHEFPVFQNRMFATSVEAIDCARGNIVLTQDTKTGLIFNRDFRPELLVYDESYQNEQAVSGRFQSHLDDVAILIKRHFSQRDVIEVGCGKGVFLAKMRELGFQVVGLDPTYEGDDPAVIKKFYSPEIGLCASGIVVRHVLEHIQNPISFLQMIGNSNKGGGLIYIEVPCFDWICRHRAWFDVFYEHVNYFRLPDFYRIFGRVLEAGHNFGGQYLYVVADLASLRSPVNTEPAFEFPVDFQASIASYRNRYKGAECDRSAHDTCHSRVPIIVWGAASKGVVFSLLMQREGITVDAVVDINPAKQGRFIPATGFKVWSPVEIMQEFPIQSDVFVMNSNYLEEIRSLTDNRFNYLVPDEITI